MPFTREFIRRVARESGIEVPKELEDALIQEHLSTRDTYAENAVKKALEENQPEPAPNVKDTQEYKDLKKQFEDYKKEQEGKQTRMSKETAMRELLKEIGVSEKRLESVLKVSDIDGLELVDGKIKDADKLKEAMKTEWADFIPTTTESGVPTPTPPANNNHGKPEPNSLAEAMRMKYEQKG